MIRPGMPVKSGKWRGFVWRIYKGHVLALEDTVPHCDFRVYPIADVRISKGCVVAAPAGEAAKRRIAKSWERAD
jgi:hypothetical protein